MKNHACPICHSVRDKQYLATVTICPQAESPLVACLDCHCHYFAVLPNSQQLANFYNQAFYDNFDYHKLTAKGQYFAKRLMRFRSQGNFLDVGCSTAHFLNGIKTHSDWQVYGTEIDAGMVTQADKLFSIEVRQGELEEVDYAKSFFDYIHVGDVLEHVRDPRAFLQACHDYLKPGGYLYLAVPNGYADCQELIRYYHQFKQTAFSPKGHLYFFFPRTFQVLFAQQGWNIKSKKTYGIKNGLRSLGILPAKKNWQSSYYPQYPEHDTSFSERNQTGANHTERYYQFRFKMKEMMRWPGMHRFGLDYIFLLSKSL